MWLPVFLFLLCLSLSSLAAWAAARVAGVALTSVVVAALATASAAYVQYNLLQWYDPRVFVFAGLWYGAMPACVLLSLIRAFRQRNWRAALPVLAPALAAGILASGAFPVSVDRDFQLRRSSREQVVDLVKQRVVTPDSGSQQVATLPGSFPVVACCGNKILILGDGPKLAFPTELGFELFMGVVYAPDDDPLTLFDGAGRIEKNFGDHWYYVVGD